MKQADKINSKRLFIFAVTILFIVQTAMAGNQVIYKPEWESLQKHPVPKWFRDVKFGIYSHLGPYTVPAFQSEWYSCLMYKPDQKPYKYHQETYGDQSTFGYKDFIPMLSLENFDADAIAELFQNSGARFVGLTAEHADGFAMWDSELTEWDAADMGPKRDIIGLMEKAVKKRGMKFVTTFHHDWNWDWYERTIAANYPLPLPRIVHSVYHRANP